ncbi:hypothetical protein [Microbacterium croceum]|nr:hypothetical protein [Microbacterium croceum]
MRPAVWIAVVQTAAGIEEESYLSWRPVGGGDVASDAQVTS